MQVHPHRAADAVAHVVGALHQRLDPLLELAQDVRLRGRPPLLLRGDRRARALGEVAEVLLLVQEDRLDLGVRERVRQVLDGAVADLGGGPRQQQMAALVAQLAHAAEELPLVSEDRLALDVAEPERVPPEQVVVEEAGRARGREDVRRTDLADVAHRPVLLADALATGELALRGLGQVVDHRPPDGAGELGEVGVVGAELQQLRDVQRMRVVLVDDPGGAVVEGERRVADRPVAGTLQRRDHESQAAVELLGDAGLGADEVPEAQFAQLVLELVGRVVRQQDPGVLRDVVAQVVRVEVVAVQVGDVEVVAVPERVPVQLRVVRERHPRREERRVHPRVAQHAAARRLEAHSRVPDSGHPHEQTTSMTSLVTDCPCCRAPTPPRVGYP